MNAALERMKSAYMREYGKNPVFMLFLTILGIFFIVFILGAIITGGDSAYYILNADRSKFFSDYFDSVFYSSDNPYTREFPVIYPPLVTVFYMVIGHFTIPFIDIPVGGTLTPELIRGTQMGMMSYLMITLITFYALYLIFSKITKHLEARKELMFLLAILLAYPFVYALERGNSIILTLVFCFLFLMFYRSENKYLRYASYIALGCAAGFKLYPAILWLLILRERDYRESAIAFLAVLVMVFVPFIFTDGTPFILWDAVLSYSGSNLGVTNINQIITGIFGEVMGVEKGIVSIISYLSIGIFTLLSIIVVLFDRDMKFWKVVALLSCNLILGFGVGVQYQIVYMAMPILYFLVSEKEMTRENLFYVICLSMTMALIPGIMIAGMYPSAVIGGMESAFVIVIAVALLYEGLARILRNRSGPKDPSAVPSE